MRSAPRATRATTVAAAAAVAALPALYSFGVRRMLHRTIRRVNEGDIDAALRGYADDVRFSFPGESSWGGHLRGKEQVGAWVRRFSAVGLQLEPETIVVSGPPWATEVCVLFNDYCEDPRGKIVYTNRGVIHARAAWGKVVRYEVFEDTERVSEFDAYLKSAGRAVD